MQRPQIVYDGLVILGLATVMHLDWHAARPVVHHLSLGLRFHWLLGVPAGALTGWYVSREWAAAPIRASLKIFGIAGVLAALVEPAWEYWIDGAPLDWAFGPLRVTTFGEFFVVGAITHAIVLAISARRPASV